MRKNRNERNWKHLVIIALMLVLYKGAPAQSLRIDPPHWYAGMSCDSLQLTLNGKGVGQAKVRLEGTEDIKIAQQKQLSSPNYLFVDLVGINRIKPQTCTLRIELAGKTQRIPYTFHARRKAEQSGRGVDASDLVYLIMPDRFANGDTTNDRITGMQQTEIDRSNEIARHGGDLQGIINRLDYLQNLGVTTLWLNPVQENDQPRESYHGYAITDHYRIDPRLGTNQLYKVLSDSLKRRDMKLVMDIIHNHWGDRHGLNRDLPDSSWLHHYPAFTRTSYRASTQIDPYATSADAQLMKTGWFDTHMPDLNQKNPYLARYLIQNNIWWVEYAGLDGLRLDTYAYPDEAFVNRCVAELKREFPLLGIVGEVWVHTVAESAYWVKENKLNPRSQELPGVTDFPLYRAIMAGLQEAEGWDDGMRRIYYTLAQDGLYGSFPVNQYIFLDNHDVSRVYASLNADLERMKMAHALLMTLRGIPQLYYGSELLMGNIAGLGATNVRQDMPGGWPDDKVNAFKPEGRTAEQNEMFDYIRRLAHWRKKNGRLMKEGRLLQLVPENNLYIYFRQLPEKGVMVVVNASDKTARIPLHRLSEPLKDVQSLQEVITESRQMLKEYWTIPGKCARIYEYQKETQPQEPSPQYDQNKGKR
jgi:glycosidase